MSIPIDLEQPNGSGGLGLTEQAMREVVAERDALRKQVGELRGQLTDLKVERDEQWQALAVIAEDKNLMIDKKDIERSYIDGVSSEELFREIDKIVSQGHSGA